MAPASAALISVSQNSVPNLDSVPPQIEALPLADESFAYVDRTHEITSARYDPTTGLLTTNATTGILVGFPSYLLGAQYVANANDNRSAGTNAEENDYLVTYTVDTPSIAYLLLDNRLDGTQSNATGSLNTTDPDLGGNLAWVLADGWTRVNTGIMPNGQADYLAIDEGTSVSGPGSRVHHDPGSGVSIENFFAIYQKQVPAGTFTTGGIKQTTSAGNMYVVAVQPVPEPSTCLLLAVAGLMALAYCFRR
jgi:hypothetical protein